MIARLQSKLRAQAYGADPTRPFGKSTRAVFSRLDTNHDRELSRDEFVAGVRRVCKLQKEEASALFDAVDFNGDDHVTPNEFVTFVDQWVVKRGQTESSNDDGYPVEKPWHRILCEQEKDTVSSLQEENRRLRSELEALDDGFFEDVEELKYRYANAVKRLTELRREDRIGGTSGDDARWNAHRWQKALVEFEESDSHSTGYVARAVFVEVMRRQLKMSYDEVMSLAKSIRHHEGNGGECFVSYRALETLMSLPLWPHSMKDSVDDGTRKKSRRKNSRRRGRRRR